jgi:hypothetical protein
MHEALPRLIGTISPIYPFLEKAVERLTCHGNTQGEALVRDTVHFNEQISFKEVTVAQLAKEFPAVYVIPKSITVFTRTRHWALY